METIIKEIQGVVTIKRYRLFTLLFVFCLLFSIRAFATQDDVRNNVVYRWDYNSISDFSELSNYVYTTLTGKTVAALRLKMSAMEVML